MVENVVQVDREKVISTQVGSVRKGGGINVQRAVYDLMESVALRHYHRDNVEVRMEDKPEHVEVWLDEFPKK